MTAQGGGRVTTRASQKRAHSFAFKALVLVQLCGNAIVRGLLRQHVARKFAPPEFLRSLLHCRRLLEAMNSSYLDSETSCAATRRTRLVEVDFGARQADHTGRGRSDPTARHGGDAPRLGRRADNVPVSVLIDKDGMREAHNFVPRMSGIPVIVRAAQRARPNAAP